MQGWQGAAEGAPVWEQVEGVPCRDGLLDGALGLVSELAGCEPESRPFRAAQQSGLMDFAVHFVAESPERGAVGLSEIYPPGVLSLAKVRGG